MWINSVAAGRYWIHLLLDTRHATRDINESESNKAAACKDVQITEILRPIDGTYNYIQWWKEMKWRAEYLKSTGSSSLRGWMKSIHSHFLIIFCKSCTGVNNKAGGCVCVLHTTWSLYLNQMAEWESSRPNVRGQLILVWLYSSLQSCLSESWHLYTLIRVKEGGDLTGFLVLAQCFAPFLWFISWPSGVSGSETRQRFVGF